MSVDLGDVVPLSISISDSDGNPANAGTVVLTVTLPDQSTTTPSIANPSPGVYEADYLAVQPGRHSVRWVATGLNAGAYTDVIDVRPADPPMIVSLSAARAHLNLASGDTSQDEELRGFVEAATAVCERYVGAVAQAAYTETCDGGTSGAAALALEHPPVIAITSVVESGTTLTSADYVLHAPSGTLKRVLGDAPYRWDPGVGNITVSYVAGRAIIPANVSLAAKIIIKHMWETQRSTAGSRPQLTESDVIDATSSYAIPYRALELLGDPVLGIA